MQTWNFSKDANSYIWKLSLVGDCTPLSHLSQTVLIVDEMRKDLGEKEFGLELDKAAIENQKKKCSSEMDDCYPIIPITSEIEEKQKYWLMLTLSVAILFCSISSLKFFLAKYFEIATFCDTRDWREFSEKVNKKIIIPISGANCEDLCGTTINILFTKIFQINYHLTYCISAYILFSLILKGKKPIWISNVNLLFPIPAHIIGMALFWNKKPLALLVGTFFVGIFSAISIIFISKSSRKIIFSLVLVCCYFGCVKLFFEFAFPYLLDWNTESTLQMLPILKYLIKFIPLTIFKHQIFLRMNNILKILILQPFLLF